MERHKFDSPWKEIVEHYFPVFVAFCEPFYRRNRRESQRTILIFSPRRFCALCGKKLQTIHRAFGALFSNL